MKELKVGDIVKVIIEEPDEENPAHEDAGKYFEIESISIYDDDTPYILKGSNWLRTREELQFIFRYENKGAYYKTLVNDLNRIILQKDNEIDHLNTFYPSHIETLETKIQELKDQLDYADEQIENQAKIIDDLEDLTHELHDKLIERIKGGIV